MKKKGARAIPDFSRTATKPKTSGPAAPSTDKGSAPAPAPRTTVKPHATSSKSGRRGS